MNQGLEKLDYVVKTSCESDGDFNYKTYYQRLVFAQRFMREEAGMKLRVGTNFKERRITMPDSKRIPFPDDFTAYVTVGFEHNGNVLTLAYNPDMTLSDYDSCGDPVAVQGGNVTGLAQNISDYAYYGDYGFYNYGTYRFGFGQRAPHFGWGGGYVAEGNYNIDLEHREFVFSADTTIDAIVLRYVSNNYDPGADNLLPIAAIDVCLKYIEHHYFRMLAKGNANTMFWSMSNDAHKKFSYGMDAARRALSSSTADELIQAFRRGAGGAVRI